MRRTMISRALEELDGASAGGRSEATVTINVRPGEKVASMLDVLAYLTQETPSAAVGEALSLHLAAYAAAHAENDEAILDAAGEILTKSGFIPEDCALGILKQRGILRVKDESLMRIVKEQAAEEGAEG